MHAEEYAQDAEEKKETALLSESSLAKDWLQPEEGKAWRNL